jgi:hypothetical protein
VALVGLFAGRRPLPAAAGAGSPAGGDKNGASTEG